MGRVDLPVAPSARDDGIAAEHTMKRQVQATNWSMTAVTGISRRDGRVAYDDCLVVGMVERNYEQQPAEHR